MAAVFTGGDVGQLLPAYILIQARMHANSDTEVLHACLSYTMMKSGLLLWTPSLNNRSKLKGQYTDVKSGCGTSVGPSINPPQSQLKQNSSNTVPLNSSDILQ